VDSIALLAIIIFLGSYLAISLEHKIKINKSAISLATGAFLWVMVVLAGVSRDTIAHNTEKAGAEIFEIVVFLLAAMTLVEVLAHYNFFDLIRIKLAKYRLHDKNQFIVFAVLTFFRSAFLDNLTITIVMIQIAKRFFTGKNLLTVVCGIVILANAGGAWSPIGDVTTIMIWLAGKFSALEVVQYGFLPSLIAGIVITFLLRRRLESNTPDTESESIQITLGEKLIIVLTLLSFTLPLFMNIFGLRPYMGLLLGLGAVWALIEYASVRSTVSTHLEANIHHLLTKVDIVSLKFFIGVLLSVSALHTLGILDVLSGFLFGSSQDTNRVIVGNIIIGLLSSVFDNVPLTAVSIDIIHSTDPHIWVLLALAAGMGGSILVIGSVAGVIAMGMIKGLNFHNYLKIGAMPALIGYFFAMGVWYLQFSIL
jgi:Na+/H+ antiporter NhaD/arsenite permease-like protein